MPQTGASKNRTEASQLSLKRRVGAFLWVVTIALICCTADAAKFRTEGKMMYVDYGARKLKMTLRTPEDDGKVLRPAVLLIHGGAWLFGTRHQLHWYGERLADNGYVTAAISYRMMPRYRFPNCLYDAKAAVRWLRLHADQYRIDPNRIAVLGNSAGGHLAALLATTIPSDGLEGSGDPGPSSAVQAAVVMYGVTDMSYYRHTKGYIGIGGISDAFVKRFLSKGPAATADPYAAASPVTYARRETCPTLLVHGTKDNFVPYAQSLAFYEQLRSLGVPSRLVTVPYGHAFDFFHHRARADVFVGILSFLNEHLNNLK
jgi:acetyl esterase/lipase